MWPFGGNFFPGTNLQDLNLDWIIKRVKELSKGIIAPYINNSNQHWMVYDTAAETFVDSGVSAAGEGTGPQGEPGKSPIIGSNGNWYEWDPETEAYVDTGVAARGSGLPAGGAAGELPVKASAADYDVAWCSFISLTSLKNKSCLLIGDSYNNGNGGISGQGWGYYFTQYTECASTIVHQNGGGFAALGNAGTASYPGKTYAECVPSITGDFDYIIAQAGWNDASDTQNPGGIPAIETGVASFIAAARNKWPNAKIVIIATNNGTDTTFVKANKLRAIAETALSNNVVSSIYSAYWLNGKEVAATDGIHLSDDGYQLLAHLMVDYVSGWDGVYYKANHYLVDDADRITQPNASCGTDIHCWFDNNTCTLSFDVTLTETLIQWVQVLQNVPAPSSALITTVSNWDDTFRRNIRANVGSTGNVSVRYGAAGNYRVFITYQLK